MSKRVVSLLLTLLLTLFVCVPVFATTVEPADQTETTESEAIDPEAETDEEPPIEEAPVEETPTEGEPSEEEPDEEAPTEETGDPVEESSVEESTETGAQEEESATEDPEEDGESGGQSNDDIMPIVSPGIVASGYCGDPNVNEGKDVTWTLHNNGTLKTGTLTISGKGNMQNYDTEMGLSNLAPWHSVYNDVTSVVIEDGITSIGDYAFYECEFTEVTLPDSVVSIGRSAFRKCYKLLTIELSDNINYIGSYAFEDCHDLTSIVLPDTLTSIENSTFEGCRSLANITIPESVTSIGSYAFLRCEALADIKIPDSVISLGEGAFSSCESLLNVVIPDSVTSFGRFLFADCYSLVNVVFPKGLIRIPDSMFLRCRSIPGDIIPDSVTAIGDSAFESCDFEEITIPDSVTYIGVRAFSSCENLKRLEIPDSVTYIGDYAFVSCYSIPSITFSGNLEYIGERAFEHCNSLESVTVSGNVTSIHGSAFADCTSLKSVNISGNVTSMEHWVFTDCTSLKDVAITGSVESMGASFARCTSLTDVIISGSVTYMIGTFTGCTSLKSITIPECVERLSGAFENCTALKSITIPGSVNQFDEAFVGCTALESVTILDGVDQIDYAAFKGCTSLKEITIPDSVSVHGIALQAFEDCISLSSIALPNGTRYVHESAFSGCTSMPRVVIPKSVTQIEEHAFGYFYNKEQEQYERYPFTIYGFLGSEAERYAKDNDIEFIPLDEESNGGGMTSPNDIKLYADKPEIKVGESTAIHGYFTYEGDFDEDSITWDVSDDSIISLEPGVSLILDSDIYPFASVTGLAEGTATVTLSLADGRKQSVDVEVTPKANPFDDSIYRADLMLDSSRSLRGVMEKSLEMQTPSDIIVDKVGISVNAAWRSLNDIFETLDSPSNLIDLGQRERDVYSAIILNILETSLKNDLVDIFKEPQDELKEIVDEIKDICKTSYDVELLDRFDFDSLDEKKAQHIKDVAEAVFKKHSFSAQAAKITKNVGTILKTADCIESVVEMWNSSVMLSEISESMKTVIRAMYRQCPSSNKPLEDALYDCIEIINTSAEELENEINKDAARVVGKGLAKYVVDKFIGKISSKVAGFPYLEVVLTGYKTGKYLLDILVNSSDTTDQYFTMCAVIEVENLLRETNSFLEGEYRKSHSTDDAKAYLASIDIIYRGMDQDCEEAYNYYDELDQSVIGGAFSALNGNDGKDSIRSIQESYFLTHESLITNWVNYLEEDYPDSGLYEKYSYVFNESEERVKKKYTAACPVDVYVYNPENELVAYVVDGKPYSNGEVLVAVEDDVKIIWFYDDANYRVEYVGNDSGKMDLTIEEYGNDETKIRSVYYYDLPLSVGKTYKTDVDSNVLGSASYSLTEEGGSVVEEDLDTYNPRTKARSVKVKNGHVIKNGEILAETTAYPGEQLEIYAYVPEGYVFKGWTSNLGDGIFKDKDSLATVVRVPDGDVEIEAIIEQVGSTVTPEPTSNPSATPEPTAEPGSSTAPTSKPTPTTSPTPTPKPDYGIIPDVPWYQYQSEDEGEYVPGPDEVTYSGFPDVDPSAWYAGPVGWAAQSGVTAGYPDGNFHPDDTCTRAQIVAFLWKAAGTPMSVGSVSFSDVEQGSFYYDAAVWAANSGIIAGYPDGNFHPDDPCTRAQIVAMLYRYANSPAVSGESKFFDVDAGAYYYNAAIWAEQNGIVAGYPDGGFHPDDACTRAQIVTMLYNYIKG